MPRKSTGQLILRRAGYYGRFHDLQDGERVRVCVALDTANKQAAKVKLARLVAEAQARIASGASATRAERRAAVAQGETFEQAAIRVHALRRTIISPRNADAGLSMLRRHAFDVIGPMPAAAVAPTDVNTVLDVVRDAGIGRGSVKLARQHMHAVFVQLIREGAITESPVDKALMPAFKATTVRERAVLTDAELAVYLQWQHPKPGRRVGVLERQVMSCVSRTFGGIRTGDLHALEWGVLDVERGAFTWGYAPRQKTSQPQLLEIPELLRPMLRRWWQLAGQPRTGLVFPVRRENCSNNRAGLERLNVSHARAFRRDLQRAFDAAPAGTAPRRGSQRWRTLFEETPVSRPVDFHSWRRAYCQALGDADVSAQQAAALAGHADLAVHAKYLRSSGKMRRIPAAALPCLDVDVKAPAKGMGAQNAEESHEPTTDALLQNLAISAMYATQGFAAMNLDTCAESREHAHLRLVSDGEKAHAQPFPAPATVAALPVEAKVGLVDLLRAIDGAVLAGELHRARELVAAAMRLAERRARRERDVR